jgi:DNA-nicking Smr family endonuclease
VTQALPVKLKVKINALSELRLVKRAIEAQAKAHAALAAAQAVKQRQLTSDKDLFTRAAGVVNPIADKRKALLKKEQAKPHPIQRQRDEEAVLRESLSDEFDATTLLNTDADLSYTRPGIGPDVVRKLRLGHWTIQAEVDLHGLRIEQARDALGRFIREAQKKGLRCVRVVHGKGLGSPGKTPVLKARVLSWLVQKNEVLAYVQAKPAQGGAGALVVLLQPG